MGSIVTLVVIIVLAGAYFLGKGQLPLSGNSPTPQATTVSQSVASSTSPSPIASGAQKEDVMVSPDNTIENIIAGVSSRDWAAIASYMTSQVGMVLYATECCAPQTPDQAAAQLDYLNSATPPWNFKENNPIAAQLRAKSEYFKDATVIGTASNKYAVGFTLNNQAKITTVVLLADYDLIIK